MKRLAAAVLAASLILLASCAKADITVTRGQGSAGNSFPTQGERIALTVNISSGTFHTDASCRYAVNAKEENKKIIYYSDINSALEDGYKPCSVCAPEYKNTEENHD